MEHLPSIFTVKNRLSDAYIHSIKQAEDTSTRKNLSISDNIDPIANKINALWQL